MFIKVKYPDKNQEIVFEANNYTTYPLGIKDDPGLTKTVLVINPDKPDRSEHLLDAKDHFELIVMNNMGDTVDRRVYRSRKK